MINRPRTMTEPYHHPPPHSFPPAVECTDEDLVQIAERAAMGASAELYAASPAYLERICDLVVRLAYHATTIQEVATAEAQESVRLRELHAQIAHENAHLRLALIDAHRTQPVQRTLERIAETAGVGPLAPAIAEDHIHRRMAGALRRLPRGTGPTFDLSDQETE